MKSIFVWACLLTALFQPGVSDIYLHCPPGSNNRLSGEGAAVTNANRLFDSQNNGNAGYNVGDKLGSKKTPLPETDQLPQEFYMSGFNDEAKTEVEIMWTNQHGTGKKADHFVESQVILQYMCQEFSDGEVPLANINTQFEYHTIRNGGTSSTQTFRANQRESSDVKLTLGLHEPYNYYQSYLRRERNKGLFTADQQLKGNSPIYTRQNKAGTRRGYEVPEERDYYPYWGPSPWKDIAIMVSDEKTLDLMKKHVNSSQYGYKYLCIMRSKSSDQCPKKNDGLPGEKCVAKYLTAEACKKAGGKWTRFITNVMERTRGVLSTCHGVDGMKLKRGVPYEPHKVSQGGDLLEQYVLVQKPPEVLYAPSTYINHNGVGRDGKFTSYKWKVPLFPSNVTQRCVLRIRYNITSDDVPREFDASDNDKVKNNPKTKATDGQTELQLALNTAQVGRTFQDRTHVFLLKPRSVLSEKYQKSTIKYIHGMGKRGNIVQAYPSMEYRFFPELLRVTTDDVVCFVWSGSNHNPRGRAGQGTDQTDRTNVCWVEEGCSSLKPPTCSSLLLDVVDHVNKFDSEKLNLHLNKGCYTGSASLNAELNNAPASCNPPCFRIMLPGEYCYMGTRNNNFSNRRHMGKVIVTQGTVFPKLDYGGKSYPGKSCKDIKDIRDKLKEKRTNGIYWITLKHKACSNPLGMEKGSITNAQITASTQHHSPYRSYHARLNSNHGSWVPRTNNGHQWLQVDLGKKTEVTGIKTQGRYNAHQWVKSYRVSYSNDGSTFQIYKENNKVKIFQANRNRHTVVLNILNPAIHARYIRILPYTWYSHISMRIELLGCPSVPKTAFPVFCDMDAGGWTMVFKAVGGVDKNVYEVYKSDQISSEDKVKALDVTNKYRDHYKNRIVLAWQAFDASEARVSLYKGGNSTVELKFSAKGTDNQNWFSVSKLTHSSQWSDIKTESKNYFSISGDTTKKRHFFINRGYAGNCAGDTGWMVIAGKRCDWERGHQHKNPILYSKLSNYTKWEKKNGVGEADVLAVFLR
ncbi:unnamed protein product [Porites lobata]|uniref:F5/8 type C domain-containing protein n=1 Tax=Porites lobata TaxID=104759 RepID=A0ABN8P7K7_9CNID|nr:unnamed protein product [Porites lobata]